MQATIHSVLLLAPVVKAAEAQARVRTLERNGDLIVGTIRALVPAKGECNHLRADADLSAAFVRITTQSGLDIWIEALELAQRHLDGEASFT